MGRSRGKKEEERAPTAGAFELEPEPEPIHSVVDCDALRDLAKKLSNPNAKGGKDGTVRTLKAIAKELEDAPQDVGALGSASAPLAEGLLAHLHGDKEVKLYVAECMVQLMRVHAPDTPFTDEQLSDVFGLIVWALARLDKPSSPTFNNCFLILQQTEQVKFYLLLLDLDCGAEMIPRLLDTLLRCARDDNFQVIEQPVTEIIHGLLSEAEDDVGIVLTPAVLDSLLLALVGRGAPDGATSRLASRVIHAAGDILQPFLQQRLIVLLSSQDDFAAGAGVGAEDKKASKKRSAAAVEEEGAHACGGVLRPADVLSALLQVYRCAPNVLLPVLPHLRGELESETDSRRTAAIDTMAQLYCLPESDVAEQFPTLKDSFLKRLTDMKPDVRAQMLSHVAALVAPTSAVLFKAELLQEAAKRLEDFTESVRASACRVLCSVAASQLGSVPLPVIAMVGKRLLDKRPSVISAAAQGLIDVFQAWATRVGRSGFSDSLDPLATWIPGSLVWALLITKTNGTSITKLLARTPGGLLPAALDNQTAAAIWAVVWEQTEKLLRDTLVGVVQKHSAAQNLLGQYADLVRRSRSRAEAQNKEANARRAARMIDHLVGGLSWGAAGAASDRAKALEQAAHLSAFKDGRVFERLATLAEAGTTEPAQRDARKDLLERLGTKGPLGDLASGVLNACLPSVVQPGALAALLDLALIGGDEDGSQAAGAHPCASGGAAGASAASRAAASPLSRAAARQMVCDIAKTAPRMLAPLVPRLARALCATGAPHDVYAPPANEHDHVGGEQAGLQGDAINVCVKVLARASSHYECGRAERDALLEKCVPALERVCAQGPPKAARWAPEAVLALHGSGASSSGSLAASAAEAVLSRVATAAAQALAPSAVEDEATPARLQALCAVGRVCPRVFADHADSLTTYVTENYLTALIGPPSSSRWGRFGRSPGSLSSLEPSQRSLSSGGGSGSEGDINAGVVLKGRALVALARALAPDMEARTSVLPEVFGSVARPLVKVLDGLMELGADLSCYECSCDADSAAMRLAAGKAMLRLAARHDRHAVPPSVWVNLGLMMQDPDSGVRAAFSKAVAKMAGSVSTSAQATASQQSSGLGGGAQHAALSQRLAVQSSKYACFLALAGMDPDKRNSQAAARLLREWVCRRRNAAQQAGEASTVVQQPEYLLPSLVYVLAHHPDMPEVVTGPDAGSQEAPDVDTLSAFCLMLQMAMEALLVGGGSSSGKHSSSTTGAAGETGASLPMVLKILAAVKSMDDADTDCPATDKIRALCAMAMAIGRAVVKESQPKGSDLAAAATTTEYPGRIQLPSTLFKIAAPSDARGGLGREGAHMPTGFTPKLDMESWGAGSSRQQPAFMYDKEAAADDNEQLCSPGGYGAADGGKKGGGGGGKKRKAAAGGKARKGKKERKEAGTPVRHQPARSKKPTVTMEDPNSGASSDEDLVESQ
ncbi:hypothetical protein FOA52_007894 [Chlamydomonas sp. UWO 241]|nr:hypothetical protein FOA52_007894 [Chlamydomonas sp. UWO 241]